jgi:hypothetical protein
MAVAISTAGQKQTPGSPPGGLELLEEPELDDESNVSQQTPAPQAPIISPMRYANGLAALGYSVIPCCWPDAQGACACPRNHKDEKHIGKAPLTPRAVLDASNRTADIFRWWSENPKANVAIDLSNCAMVDPDSPEALQEAQELGLPPTLTRISKNVAYLYKVPSDTPKVRLIHRGKTGNLDILTMGYCIVYGKHQTGCPVYLENPRTEPAPAPTWVLGMIEAYAQAQKAREEAAQMRVAERQMTVGGEPPVRLWGEALDWWRGVKAAERDGGIDRSLTLWRIAQFLARANASEAAITDALAERDLALGYSKYADRRDGVVRYDEIARKVVGRAREYSPKPARSYSPPRKHDHARQSQTHRKVYIPGGSV